MLTIVYFCDLAAVSPVWKSCPLQNIIVDISSYDCVIVLHVSFFYFNAIKGLMDIAHVSKLMQLDCIQTENLGLLSNFSSDCWCKWVVACLSYDQCFNYWLTRYCKYKCPIKLLTLIISVAAHGRQVERLSRQEICQVLLPGCLPSLPQSIVACEVYWIRYRSIQPTPASSMISSMFCFGSRPN